MTAEYKVNSPWWVFPEMFLLPLSSTCMPEGAEERVVRQFIVRLFNSISRQTWCDFITCWASVSDWNVMYQLLLCANSTLITFGQLSFLNSDSTSCKMNTRNHLTWLVNITYNLMFPETCRSQSSRYSLYLNRCGFRDFPQDDNAPLVIWTHFLPFLVHLYHRRGWGKFRVIKSRPHLKCMQIFLTHHILNFQLTSQHIQDELHVGGEDLDALHAGYSPNWDKLVAVHLGHQVQILREVFSEWQNKLM